MVEGPIPYSCASAKKKDSRTRIYKTQVTKVRTKAAKAKRININLKELSFIQDIVKGVIIMLISEIKIQIIGMSLMIQMLNLLILII